MPVLPRSHYHESLDGGSSCLGLEFSKAGVLELWAYLIDPVLLSKLVLGVLERNGLAWGFFADRPRCEAACPSGGQGLTMFAPTP